MGNADNVRVSQQSSDRYIGCYGRWLERKKKYVAWKERNGEEMDTKTVFSGRFDQLEQHIMNKYSVV